MKVLLFILVGLVLLVAAGGAFLSWRSQSGSAIGLVDGALAPCPQSPNCVCSEPTTPDTHSINPFPASSWDALPGLITEAGGTIVEQSDDYIAATFQTPLMRYVDDVEFRRGEDAVHIRSASRVGRSDMGANRERLEAMRVSL